MIRYRKFFSIRNKLILFILISILIPNILIIYHVNLELTKYLEKTFNETTKKEIMRVDDQLNIYINVMKENIEFLSNAKEVKKSDSTIKSYVNNGKKTKMTPSENGGIEEEIYNLYSKFGESHPKLKYVYMATEEGSFLQWPEGDVSENYDPRKRPWYETAIKNKGQVIITDPYYYPAGNIAVISFVKTIENDQNKVIGVQGIDISLEEIANVIENVKIGENGYIILLDKAGTIIADSDNSEMNFKNIEELKIEKLKNIQEMQSDSFEINLDGTEKLVNVYTSPKNHLKFVSFIDKEEVLHQINKIKDVLITMVEICIMIAVVVAIIISNKFSKPILKIKDHLEYIGLGDFKKKLPKDILKRNDEIGTLSVALETMQNKLENSIIEIRNSEKTVIAAKKEIKENLNFFQTLMNTIPNPIFAKDEYGVYNHCNKAFAEYVGVDKEKIIGHTVYEIGDKSLADTYYKADNDLMQNKGEQIYESRIINKVNNKESYVVFNKASIINDKGEVKGIVGVVVDITEERKNKEKINKLLKLKEAMLQIAYSTNGMRSINEMLQLILDKVIECVDEESFGSVLVLNKDNKLNMIVANGYDDDKIGTFSLHLEKSFAWIFNDGNLNKTVVVNDIDKFKEFEVLNTKHGDKIKSVISAPIIVDNKLYGFINLDSKHSNIFGEMEVELMDYIRYQISLAITKHNLYEESIRLSQYDKLTNVYNRNYFEHLLHTDINKAIEDNIEFFVAVFDLNGLKVINDNFGHLAGDILIKTFAEGLKKYIKDGDIIARFGGDEFIGIYFNRNLESLNNSFKDLNKYFNNNPIDFENNKIICSYSYGISNFPKDGDDFNNLIKIADKKMYENKNISKEKMKNNL